MAECYRSVMDYGDWLLKYLPGTIAVSDVVISLALPRVDDCDCLRMASVGFRRLLAAVVATKGALFRLILLAGSFRGFGGVGGRGAASIVKLVEEEPLSS